MPHGELATVREHLEQDRAFSQLGTQVIRREINVNAAIPTYNIF